MREREREREKEKGKEEEERERERATRGKEGGGERGGTCQQLKITYKLTIKR